MNSVQISGRLVRDPIVKENENGTAIMATFSVEVSRPKDKKVTDYIDCVAWSPVADRIAKKCKKDQNVTVYGIIATHLYKRGDDRKRFLEVHVDDVFLSEQEEV